jgi:hypothetical protein|uniref:Glycosyltransferase n=1 Tax=viral metagenome TaxID=1070528 RepID=A0A6C0CW92_9ZZZZ
MSYGFIVLRHVTSELTNQYWNECVRCIRRFYPQRKIVIIDDNSNKDFVKAEFEYNNIEYIQSEFPQRGEILPYYYFHKHHFFENAVIIHDSVFIHKRINFDTLKNLKVVPLWHFSHGKDENTKRSLEISSYLKNNDVIKRELHNTKNFHVMGLGNPWQGCFGVQSYINYHFLSYLQEKYGLFNVLKVVKCRTDRCCLERIYGVIISLEFKELTKIKSLLGSILSYRNSYYSWGYSFEQYKDHINKYKKSPVPIVKVWTGR